MTTTVFRIFNEYLQKVPEWQAEAFNYISEHQFDAAKASISMRIISSISNSVWGFQNGKLEAYMDLFFTFSECNMQGRTIEDLTNYIHSICEYINTFSRLHLRFNCCLSSNLTGGTMRIGWEF